MHDRLREFASTGDMAARLADEIVARLKSAVEVRGHASLVVSGGTTPGALFDVLCERDAPWGKVWITLSDERWIAPSEDGSNEKLVRTRLLRGKAAGAHFTGMKTSDAKPENAQTTVETAISAMPRPFDVVLLGMGDDGHTASLYPRAPELKAALDTGSPALVHAVHAQNAAATGDRMTLTLRALLDTRWIALLIKGEEKMETYRAAESGSDVTDMPVRAVLGQAGVPVEVFWSP
ncbi:MAG: 6-phosphogluconolactonase [Proteobacteria bacterium]|nr:6-phosphogluconolactonase [Pseudomonadota bacterium]